MVGRGGTVDSSQREYRKLGTVEQVEPGSAVVDEGGLAVAWREFAVRTAKVVRQDQALGAIKHHHGNTVRHWRDKGFAAPQTYFNVGCPSAICVLKIVGASLITIPLRWSREARTSLAMNDKN
jgi:hypothetical protein